jgi:hypothetical protein
MKIRAQEANLRQNGQVACIILATDGESSDGNVAQALAPLKQLPVHIVLRLCTNEEKVVEYWNGVDKELELNIDVVDDLFSEAKSIQEKNKWLTYGEPIHRMREFGITSKEYDLLDESRLSMEQMVNLCSFM